MSKPTYQWHKIAESVNELQFGSNNLLVLIVNNKKLTIGKGKEKLFGCAYACPHAGGVLAHGYIDAMDNVVCPLHHYRFSLLNGRNSSGEGYFLKTYPVEVREDGVYVQMEEKRLFGFL